MSLSTRLSLRQRAALCSLAVLAALIVVWQAATSPVRTGGGKQDVRQ